MTAFSLIAASALIALLFVVAVILYCNGLILISQLPQLIKYVLTLVLYSIFSCCIVAPLWFAIMAYKSSVSDVIELRDTLVIVVGYVLIISPGVLMLKSKYLHQLKRLGYYR